MATPIGNAGDITLRALDALRSADAILCEDTRVSARLLARHGISRPLLPYHEHNAERMRPKVLERLRAGQSLALVSDAGQPLISDPGFKLLRAAIAEGLPVTALPGPSAALTALVLSGQPTDRFFFAGFLTARSAQRRRELADLAGIPATLIFFESPQRLPGAIEHGGIDRGGGLRRVAAARHVLLQRDAGQPLALDVAAHHDGARHATDLRGALDRHRQSPLVSTSVLAMCPV